MRLCLTRFFSSALLLTAAPNSLARLTTARDEGFSCTSKRVLNSTEFLSALTFHLQEEYQRLPAALPTDQRLAGIYGEETRELARSLRFPESAIGRLNDKCTSTLVTRCHIVTAAHCVLNNQKEPLEKNEFVLSRRVMPDRNLGELAINVMSDIEGYQKNPTLMNDVAFVRLTENVGELVGHFAVEHPNDWTSVEQLIARRGNSLLTERGGCRPNHWYVSGYSKDWANGPNETPPLTTDLDVDFIENAYGELFSRADTFSGSSGGPVYRVTCRGCPYWLV